MSIDWRKRFRFTAERGGERAGGGGQLIAAEAVVEAVGRRGINGALDDDKVRVGALLVRDAGAGGAGRERLRRVAREAERERRRLRGGRDEARRQAHGRRHLLDKEN